MNSKERVRALKQAIAVLLKIRFAINFRICQYCPSNIMILRTNCTSSLIYDLILIMITQEKNLEKLYDGITF